MFQRVAKTNTLRMGMTTSRVLETTPSMNSGLKFFSTSIDVSSENKTAGGNQPQQQSVKKSPTSSLASINNNEELFRARHSTQHLLSYAFKRYITGNQQFREDETAYLQDSFDHQAPHTTMIECCDSRVAQQVMGRSLLGEIFKIRNIGNQYSLGQASVDCGLLVLNTPLCVVMGHTGCLAIKAGIDNSIVDVKSVVAGVEDLGNAVQYAESQVNKKDYTDREWNDVVTVEQNVDYQIASMLNQKAIRDKVLDGQLQIVGMVYDLHKYYGQDHGLVQVVNLNGTNNPEKYARHPLFSFMSNDEKDQVMRRYVDVKK